MLLKDIDIMAKFKYHNSTHDGDENRLVGASTFFKDKFWTENQCLHKSYNGELIISKLQSTNISLIAGKVFAPNNHNATYYENMKDIILDIQAGNPNYSIIIIGDFNITFENRDNTNRNADIHEINSR
jgi:hypothetical protein